MINRYHSHFGTRVNEELWCDSGFGTSEDALPADFYFPPYNLTESKWIYTASALAENKDILKLFL